MTVSHPRSEKSSTGATADRRPPCLICGKPSDYIDIAHDDYYCREDGAQILLISSGVKIRPLEAAILLADPGAI